MKTHILPAIRLTVACLVLLAVAYPLALWAVAQLAPNKGEGFLIEANGNKYYSNIGQAMNDTNYFMSRPSAVDYDASGSGASNKGPSNEEYLQELESRIQAFMAINPGVERNQIPADMITASGSGLDPHISVAGAKVQIPRIAKARNLALDTLEELVNKHIESPLWGMFGPKKVHVLKLNLALDALSSMKGGQHAN